jgi:SOS-response transcriptional repressor LexA
MLAGDPTPTLHEIITACDISSHSVASYHLARLAKEGKIVLYPGQTRRIDIVAYPYGRYTEAIQAAREAVWKEPDTIDGEAAHEALYSALIGLGVD